jgi:hypothetical protein
VAVVEAGVGLVLVVVGGLRGPQEHLLLHGAGHVLDLGSILLLSLGRSLHTDQY